MQRHRGVVQLDGGRAVSGATVTVTTYPGGTAAALYSDDGVTPMASNVVETDATGEYWFYVANGRYTLEIETDYGSETVDDVSIFDPDDGGGGSGTGTVTSVAISVPSVLSASGSPITGAGTLALTYSGTALPNANGGTGRTTNTAYAVVCGGTTTGGAEQSIAGVGTAGQVLTSNGAGALPSFQAAATGLSAAVQVDRYTSTGAATWTKPSGARLVQVICIGGGGGGGGGGRSGGGAGNYPAGGGGGGGRVEAWFPASALGATEAVNVGTGGTGGTGSTVVAGARSDGTAGGSSTFGTTLVRAYGGGGGGGNEGGGGGGAGLASAGGTPTTTSSGTAGTFGGALGGTLSNAPADNLTGFGGAGGAVALSGTIGTTGGKAFRGGNGGGGGGGISTAAGGTAVGAGDGTSAYPDAAGGAAGTSSSAGTPTAGGAGTNPSAIGECGGSGGGGGSSISNAGAVGGAGGVGSGGGGGGATYSASGGGNGGAGGRGEVVVITYF